MNKKIKKPRIIWVLQENQVSPAIVEYLKLLKSSLGKIDITFMVPHQDKRVQEMVKTLDPVTFKISRHDLPRSQKNYFKKRDQIKDAGFRDGLKVWRTLLVDDLGEGVISEIHLHFKPLDNVRGIVLQIPTPLGSSFIEEQIFYAWTKLARDNNTFIAGYELLSLNTRWTLVPSMVDGIITTHIFSRNTLNEPASGIKGKIWQLPRNEAKVFTPGTGPLWLKGLNSPFHYRIKHNILPDVICVYIPHNVAMGYEYGRLLDEIKIFGHKIHLMFSIGEDQIRGTHSHEEIIKTISRSTLDNFCSYSFHDLDAPWEMTGANFVLACSESYSTKVAEGNGIPCYVMDEYVNPARAGYLEITNDYGRVREIAASEIKRQAALTPMVHILHDIVQNNFPKIEV